MKPWYYQEWFLFPVLPFWPVWAILIIRSPWNNGLVSGAVAWAMLFVGAYWIGWLQLYQEHRLNELTIAITIPGLILTIITQVHWVRYRGVVREQMGLENAGAGISSSPAAASGRNASGPPRPRPRRKARRRR